jgi:anthranilate 1,2-dioxygenase small subunit
MSETIERSSKIELTAALQSVVERFLIDYGRCLDDHCLEEWPGFFVEDGCYKVVSRENLQAGLPAAMIYHYSRAMLEDGVTTLRGLLTFEFVYSRHILGSIRILETTDSTVKVTSNYALYQSTEEGQTRLFSVSRYIDEIVFVKSEPKFKARVVVPDTSAIYNCLAAPI